jgi:hypothetical protein
MVRPQEYESQNTQTSTESLPPPPVPEQKHEVTSALNPNEDSQLRLVALIMAGGKQRLGGHILSAHTLRSRSV